MNYCSKCGNKYGFDANICPVCGNSIKDASVDMNDNSWNWAYTNYGNINDKRYALPSVSAASIVVFLKFCFAFFTSGIIGVAIVKAVFFDMIETSAWSIFWQVLFTGGLSFDKETVASIIRSNTFIKTMIGFIAGSAFGVLIFKLITKSKIEKKK